MKDNNNLLIVLIILVTLDLATNIFTYIKINNDFSEEKIVKIVKTSIAESQKESVKEFLDLLGLSKEKLEESNKKAKLSSLKSNMHTFQTMIETYSVDWGGIYPSTFQALVSESNKNKYYKDLQNPFTASVWGDDYSNYLTSSTHSDFKGLVLFEPLSKSGSFTEYKIRGVDEDGNLIDYVLTNY